VEGKLVGDGVLAVFTSARQAIECALRCNTASAPCGLQLHLGIHAGDVIREGNNVYGGAVNIAARIAGASDPGELLVSQTVRDLARTSAGVTFEDRGEHELKGVAEPVRMWAVREGRTISSSGQSETSSLDAEPYVAADVNYGPTRDGIAALINLKVSKKRGAFVRNARGRLVSVTPITDDSSIASLPQSQFPSGLLQWSSRYGGREEASFRTECELDVLAFENNDESGSFVYANEAFRDKHRLLLAVCPWKVTVEVFAETGERVTCLFIVRKGTQRVLADASPRGTLYEPELESWSIAH
jgi:hypothetical protein